MPKCTVFVMDAIILVPMQDDLDASRRASAYSRKLSKMLAKS